MDLMGTIRDTTIRLEESTRLAKSSGRMAICWLTPGAGGLPDHR